jgi:hypothetical protein
MLLTLEAVVRFIATECGSVPLIHEIGFLGDLKKEKSVTRERKSNK